MRKRRLGVVGVGTAGILSLTHFCTWLDRSWDVVSIYDPNRPILGIGESTNGGFVALLQRGLRFCLGDQRDLDALDATLKFGSNFVDWRPRPFLNPLLDGDVAIHFNNFYLKEYAFRRLRKLWPGQFHVLEGAVSKMEEVGPRVLVTVNDIAYDFDYIVDCTGFPQNFEGYTFSDCSPVTRCLVHSVEEHDGQRVTDHLATKHGWMFGVPLQSRKTFGYLYNHELTTQNEAAEDMMALLGVESLEKVAKSGESICREYPFRSYYTNDLVQGRICRNGNRALFFEPLVANSIFLYIHAVQLFFDHIVLGVDHHRTNLTFRTSVQQLEDLISYYYHGGSVHKSPFWKHAQAHTRARLAARQPFQQIMAVYRAAKEQGVLYTAPSYGFAPQSWESVDEHFGFGYIDPAFGPSAPVTVGSLVAERAQV